MSFSSLMQEPLFLFALLAGVALILAGLGIYGIMMSGKSEREQYLFLSSLSALRRKFTDKHDARPWAFIYVGLDMLKMRNVYSQVETKETHDHIMQMLLTKYQQGSDGLVSGFDDGNFIVITHCSEAEFQRETERFFSELSRFVTTHRIIRMPNVRFGYYLAKSSGVSFDEAVSRAKKVYKYAETKQVRSAVWDYEEMRGEMDVENLELKINDAIDNDRFHIEIQPFVDAHTEQVIGGEVLSRLNLDGQMAVQPNTFLSAVSNVGILSKFDYYVFRKCCAWVAANQEAASKMRYLSCNFSRHTISMPDFARKITQIADEYGVSHPLFVIEMTEEEKEKESAVVMQNLEQLKKVGFTTALDDFGCGFTSFSDLQNYPVDMVKLDKSIMDNAETEKGRVILKNILKMINDLGCVVLCESVETKEQLELVKDIGCDIIQGFYFYKPLPAEKFEELLRAVPKGEELETMGVSGDFDQPYKNVVQFPFKAHTEI